MSVATAVTVPAVLEPVARARVARVVLRPRAMPMPALVVRAAGAAMVAMRSPAMPRVATAERPHRRAK